MGISFHVHPSIVTMAPCANEMFYLDEVMQCFSELLNMLRLL